MLVYLEYVLSTGVCSAFRIMAIFKGYAVKTHAALAIALPLIIHLAGRFQVWGGPHSCLDDNDRLDDRAFLDVTVFPKLCRSGRPGRRSSGCNGWTGRVVNGPS